LATFAAALTNGLSEIGIRDVGVVRAAVDASRFDDMRVVAVLRPGSDSSRCAVARRVNDYECLLLQHEYGIYGGHDGAEVLDLLAEVDVPVVTTLHTVALKPSASQRTILERVVAASAAVVTMTGTARSRLINHYDVDPTKVTTIVHGATVPRALENDGESYHDMLMQRAVDLRVHDQVEFDPSYRPLGSLLDLISEATCVVLPYDSDDQITSGVLVDAIAAGRPVIATRFPHATEVLTDGPGLLVSHSSPQKLADAMEKVITDHAMVANMSMVAAAMAPSYRWTSVAADYADLAARVANPSPVSTPVPALSRVAAFGVGQ